METIAKVEIGEIERIDENVFCLNITYDDVIEVKHYQELFDNLIKLVNGKPFGYIANALNRYPKTSIEALNYVNKHESFNELCYGLAILLNNYPTRLLINFYLSISSNNIPTKTFPTKIEGIEWVKKHIK